MRKEGLEPPYPFGYQILSLSRLPVPPLSRQCRLAGVRGKGEGVRDEGRHGRASIRRVTDSRNDLFHGLFVWHRGEKGPGRLARHSDAPGVVPDPATGRPLKVASVELSDRGICPACTQLGAGGYVSFEADLRLAFACPSCRKLVWISGA